MSIRPDERKLEFPLEDHDCERVRFEHSLRATLARPVDELGRRELEAAFRRYSRSVAALLKQ